MSTHRTTRTPSTPARVLQLFALLVALVASTLTLTAAPATAATPTGGAAQQRGGDLYDCDDFDKDDNIRWLAAQRAYVRAGGGAKDPYNLDDDRDGYACETLAVKTKVNTEPECHFIIGTDDCAGRNQYRNTYWLTWNANRDVHPTNQVTALKGALLDTFAAQASTRPAVIQHLENAYDNVTTSTVGCIRKAMLEFIYIQAEGKHMADAFADLLGIGQKVIQVIPVTAPFSKVVNKFIKMGGKAAKSAAGVAIMKRAMDKLDEAATC